MEIKSKLTGLAKKVITYPIKTVCALGLAGLVAVTALKDNVHFGSIKIHDPQENHYVWGIASLIEIEGKNSRGNFYNIGLIGSGIKLKKDSTFQGNMNSYGLVVGYNEMENNSTITGNMISKGFVAGGLDTVVNLGTNAEIGLKNYVHYVKKEPKE